MVIKLNKHEAKILKHLLTSDKKEYCDTLHYMADQLDSGNFSQSGFKRRDYPSLIGHTADAVAVINSVLKQI